MKNLLTTVHPYIQWPHNWKELITMMEGCRHEIKIIFVHWEKPQQNVYRLNTGGSTMTNSSKIGCGGGDLSCNSWGGLVHIAWV
ncbi:hypothetical protein H5410_008966 [Solanum commersonii]|uniref:Uncharacterized protein n=1 Tax=Solanum commersonii TaxID=4109 RepID=A0A9J6AHF7_SOLCO|nr:hypothetical protein H5410_008966 [Solanum commersonii]